MIFNFSTDLAIAAIERRRILFTIVENVILSTRLYALHRNRRGEFVFELHVWITMATGVANSAVALPISIHLVGYTVSPNITITLVALVSLVEYAVRAPCVYIEMPGFPLGPCIVIASRCIGLGRVTA